VNRNVLANTKHTDNVSVWIYFSAITVQSNINCI